jgi:hypothetical protein
VWFFGQQGRETLRAGSKQFIRLAQHFVRVLTGRNAGLGIKPKTFNVEKVADLLGDQPKSIDHQLVVTVR